MGTENGQAERKPQRPTHEIRIGHVKAAIWAVERAGGLRHDVKVSRVDKGSDDEWRTSDSFGPDDLLLLAKVLDLAHTWIVEDLKLLDLPPF